MYYGHQLKSNPPVIQIFINQLKFLDKSYPRYLQNVFIRENKLKGTSVKLKFVEKNVRKRK